MDLPKLRPDQAKIATDPAKIKVLAMGRRWGKTVLGGAIVGAALRQHGKVAWIAPTYKNTRPMWRWLISSLGSDIANKRVTVDKSGLTIETKNNGLLSIYSGDNIDSIRGEAFHLVVLDEAAKLDEYAWTDAIMPTLADYDGEAVLISTPRGRNWFWREWVTGIDDNGYQKSWTAPTLDNPIKAIQAAFERAKQRVPERTFLQEWMAQFVDDGGGVFRGVRQAAILQPQEPSNSGQYLGGIDWALSYDSTVFTVIDALTGQQVYLDRFTGVDYGLQRVRIAASAKRYNVVNVLAEANGMGKPNNDELRRMGIPVRDFVTSNASKAEIIENLAAGFELGNIKILDDAVQLTEIESYESERLPGGMVRYNAPKGMHDDTVIALALAYYATKSNRVDIVEENFFYA